MQHTMHTTSSFLSRRRFHFEFHWNRIKSIRLISFEWMMRQAAKWRAQVTQNNKKKLVALDVYNIFCKRIINAMRWWCLNSGSHIKICFQHWLPCLVGCVYLLHCMLYQSNNALFLNIWVYGLSSSPSLSFFLCFLSLSSSLSFSSSKAFSVFFLPLCSPISLVTFLPIVREVRASTHTHFVKAFVQRIKKGTLDKTVFARYSNGRIDPNRINCTYTRMLCKQTSQPTNQPTNGICSVKWNACARHTLRASGEAKNSLDMSIQI